jgi:hypothetical protein
VSPGVVKWIMMQCVILVIPPMCWGVAKLSAIVALLLWLITTVGCLVAYVRLQLLVRER